MMAKSLKNENGAGHNSGGMIDGDALKRYVSRAIRLLDEQDEAFEEHIKPLKEDLNEVYKEAKSAGFVRAHLRKIVQEQRMNPEERNAIEALRHALGEFAETPLGEAAVEREEAPRRRRGRPARAPIEAAREHLGEMSEDEDWGEEVDVR
jgi:uncharacterized protein (UPF0335 family)